MQSELHHVAVFITDMDRCLVFFKNLLGLNLIWRVHEVSGKKISSLLAVEKVKAEMALLANTEKGCSVELIRVYSQNGKDIPFDLKSHNLRVSLSFSVTNLEQLRQKIINAGWKVNTKCLSLKTPEGKPISVFTVSLEQGVSVELIEFK